MKPYHLSSLVLAALMGAAGQAWSAGQATVVLENGVNGYEGTFDRRIGPGGETDGINITGQTTYYLDGGSSTLNDAGYTHGLIRFNDVETLVPAGAKITSAKLTVVQKTHSNAQSGDSFSVYRLTRAFNSDSSVGGDFGADGLAGDVDWILGSFSPPNIASTASVLSADVTRAVQSWVDGSPNLGLGIRSDRGTNAWSFHTTGATAGLRPKLEITYLLDEGVTANDFQQDLNGYIDCSQVIFNAPIPVAPDLPSYTTIVGSTVQEAFLDGINPPTLEPDISSMIRFGGVETLLAGRKIESATLKVVTGFSSSAATSPGPFTVHRLLVPFTETSAYADFAGDAGAMLSAGQITPAIATFTDMANCEVIDVDISDAVRSWATGAPNHGLYIGSGSPNGWQVFTTGATDASFRPLLRVVSSPPLPVEIVSPTASSRHVQGTVVTLQADTSVAPPATVSQVEFFVDGNSAGIDTSAPYTLSYPASTLGNFVLTAAMTDSTSTVVVSEPVAFSVVPAAGIGGLYFDGIADHVALGDAAELKLSTFTLETWFRRETNGVATTTGTGGVIAIPLIAKGRNQADNSTLDTNWFLGIRESDGVLCADFEASTGGTNVPVAGITPVSTGIWQHAAATFDGTEWRLYLNGNLEGALNAGGRTPRADSIQHASIATAMNSNGLGEGAFGGFMDEVRIWNTARTHSEIRQSINSEVSFAAGLIARWAMGEGTGSTITSSASAATAGTFGSAPVWTTGQSFSNNTKPSIAFATPENGGNFLNTSPLQLTVSANDPDGSVTQVEYFDNGVSIGVSTVAPFSFTYSNPPVGTRRLLAVVTDNGGETSRTDSLITVYTTFASPTVPGYSAGIIDGADAELFTGTPAANPAMWSVVSASNAPRALDNPGTVPGDIAVSVNGSPVSSSAGVVLAANAVLNGNFAALDNVVAPYHAAGFYHVSSMDNSGPGELEPTLAAESSSFSLGWFPYADGWIGANIAADGTVSTSSSLPASVTITNTAAGIYQINGLPVSGNLLAVAFGNGTDNYTSIGQSGDNWIVNVRDNNQNLENGDFSILYVPGTAERVLSGKIGNLGEFTALNDELARLGVSTRLTAQGYQLTFGDGSVINPSNTALFISPDTDAGNGGDNVYAYSTVGNSFVVFSHDLPGLNGVLQNGGFRFLATPLNTMAPNADEVVLSVADARAAEDGTDQTLVFNINRLGNTAVDLTVNYAVTGTATSGSDYTGLPGAVTIPAGSASAQVTVSALADSALEPMETVTLTIAAGSGYTPGLHTAGTGSISDALSTLPTTTLVFQEGLNGYTGQFQKRVGYALSNGTYTAQLGSGVTSYALDGGDPDINDLIRFDNIINGAGGIPAGAKVLKAELILTTAVANDAQTGGPFIVDRLTSAVDQDSTYDSISSGIGFEGVRGISTGLPVAGFPALAQGEAGAADVTHIVRSWASGQANHGFSVFSGGTTDGWNYCTVGNANVSLRPKLVVTYINQPTREYTYTADQSARINSAPGSTTIDGSTLDAEFIDMATNNTQEALMRFPVAFSNETPGAIPLDEDIVKAELLVTTANSSFSTGAQSPGPITIHQMLADWTTTTSYGLNGPQIGTQISESAAAMTGLGQGSTTWVDVTAIVRAWRAGASNYGVNLKPSTGDDWMLFWPGTSYGDSATPRLRITTAGGSIPNDVPFDVWSATFNAAGIALDSDDDHDGISALVEYALGLNPTAANVLPGITRDGNAISLSFAKGIQAAGDSRVSYIIKSSTDLQTWTEETPTVNNATVITIDQAIGIGNKFFRLEVVYTP